MFDSISKFFKKFSKEKNTESKDTAKERLHLVLMQDRANVSADFLELMKQEIIEVIKKYIDVDENLIDVKLTNKINNDGTTGAPALYANIPIVSIKDETRKISTEKKKENELNKQNENKNQEKNSQENEKNKKEEAKKEENKQDNKKENKQEVKEQEVNKEVSQENKKDENVKDNIEDKQNPMEGAQKEENIKKEDNKKNEKAKISQTA